MAPEALRTAPARLAPLPALLLLGACATFAPDPTALESFLQRAETRTEGGLTVTAAVPTREESKRLLQTVEYDPTFALVADDPDVLALLK